MGTTLEIVRKLNTVMAIEASWYPNNYTTVMACRQRSRELEEQLLKENEQVYNLYQTLFGRLFFMLLGKAEEKEALGADFVKFRVNYMMSGK